MLVLCYHRVTTAVADPWGLCVSPDRFNQQMEVLRLHAEPLPLAELVARAARPDPPARAVAVTFDDGYVDNLLAAAPVLRRWGGTGDGVRRYRICRSRPRVLVGRRYRTCCSRVKLCRRHSPWNSAA